MSELKFNFGKYKSSLVSDAVKKDPSYCKWVLNQPMCPNEIKAYILSIMNMDQVMKWGKYRNKTLNHIAQTDKKYINWLLGNEYVKSKCPELLEELNKIVEKFKVNNIQDTKDAKT